MGIFGLTSYVMQHKSEFHDDFKLFNCPVLIDGNSAASLIYSNLTRSNHAFGGDYDKYACSTRDFVQLFLKCGLSPVFIFDGGYEQRKLKTVLDRIKMNIIVCGQYKNKYRESKSFPLMLRDAFRAVLQELDVSIVQCDFEADIELVVLSRLLNCPLISYDSDFCFTDSRYIPFTSIDLKAVRFKKKSTRRKYYLHCQMFNIDKFLSRFGVLVDKSMLPLLSCALGNDYIPPNTFKNFLQLNHIVKFEERVSKIVQWMAKISSVDRAIDQMVTCVEKSKESIKRKIINLLADYNRKTSYLLDFVPPKLIEETMSQDLTNLSIADCQIMTKADELPCLQSDLLDVEASLTDEDENTSGYSHSEDDDIIVLGIEEYEIHYTDDEVVDSSNESYAAASANESKIHFNNSLEYETKTQVQEFEQNFAETKLEDNIMRLSEELNAEVDNVINDSKLDRVDVETSGSQLPRWFVQKYRRGAITPNLINVINFQRIFIPSQSEDYFNQPSHEICLPILQLIIGIVLGGNQARVSSVKCHARSKAMQLGVYEVVPVYEVLAKPLPTLSVMDLMPVEERASILLNCLDLPATINLTLFPCEWRLYILILMYWKKHCKQPAVNSSHVRAAVLCLIYLSVVDRKIGFVRSPSDLKRMRKEKKRPHELVTPSQNSESSLPANGSLTKSHEADGLQIRRDSLVAGRSLSPVKEDPPSTRMASSSENPPLNDVCSFRSYSPSTNENPSSTHEYASRIRQKSHLTAADHSVIKKDLHLAVAETSFSVSTSVVDETQSLSNENLSRIRGGSPQIGKIESVINEDGTFLVGRDSFVAADVPSQPAEGEAVSCSSRPPFATLNIAVPREAQPTENVGPCPSAVKPSPQIEHISSPINDGSCVGAEMSLENGEHELFGNANEANCVDDLLDLISEDDCYKCANALLTYHQVDPALVKNRKGFDRKVIHSFAQLQHCIQSISMLNSVLDFPFSPCPPHTCFSGTFLYNFYSELYRRKLGDGYVTRNVLTKASTIIALYRYLVASWEVVTSAKVVYRKFEIKKKKKKKEPLKQEVPDDDYEPEMYHDADNIFALLPEE